MLIVDPEEAHLDVVVEHGPRHRGIVVDGPERLQQFLIDAIEEHEVAGVDHQDNVGPHDPVLRVLLKPRQALRLERALDLPRAVSAIEGADRRCQRAVAHQRHDDIGGCLVVGHRDVEVIDAVANVSNDLSDLGAAVRLGAAFDIHPNRPVELADAVDPPGHMELGPERDLEKAFDDLRVGELLDLRSPARRDLRIFGGRRSRHDPGESHGRQRRDQEAAGCTLFRASPKELDRLVH